jgi:putative phosphotransacetylase
MRELSQLGEFAAEEKIDIQSNLKPKTRKIPNVRILGPIRKQTQVEISHTDAIFLKVKPMVRESGNLKGTPGVVLVGPRGKIKIKEGVINAWRHIHCSPKESQKLGLKNKMLVSVKTMGIRSITFHKVMVQVKPNYRLYMHLDTDEGNAACIVKKGIGYLII